MPHQCRDPLVAAAQIVVALQSIVARNVDPVQRAVVSVTQVHGGDTFNVIPETAMLTGTVRSFLPEVRDLLERRLREIATGLGAALGVGVEIEYQRGYPPTVNTEAETELAALAAAEVAGADKIDRAREPTMGAEDFAYMLEQRPGSYVFIGNGGGEDTPMLHSPHYDFSDDALPYGASYWARLVERALPAR